MRYRALAVSSSLLLATAVAHAAPQDARQPAERLDRGIVAVQPEKGKVFVSWRLLESDAEKVAFNVYRSSGSGTPTKLNAEPIANVTFFEDTSAGTGEAKYVVRPVVDGKELEASEGFALAADAPVGQYIQVPLKTPADYSVGDCSAADLDGDGQYELIVHFVGRGKDNSQKGETDPPILAAYRLDGHELWRINLGHNIREGAHYTQFQVFDYDGDGKAELICKTADGTTDAKGKVLGDGDIRHANEGGYILAGPEFLTVFNGETGEAIDTIPYQPGRGGPGVANGAAVTGDQLKAMWGDGYGNRGDRFLAGTAYLDGKRPTAIFSRGYYTRSFVWAVDFDGKKLKQRWLFDSEDSQSTSGRSTPTNGIDKAGPKAFSGQGFHSLSIADVDGDGKDEVVFGAMTIDDNGKGLYTTGWGHGDALHVGDLDPDNPGLEVFGIQERFDDAGAHLHDAKTGKPLFKRPSAAAAKEGGDKGEGPGRGVAFDIDPTHPGAENWTAGAGIAGLYDIKGEKIGDKIPSSCNFRIFWDGDGLSELLDKNRVSKWDWKKQQTDVLFTAEGYSSINGTKATPCLSADLFGDWREEFVLRADDNQSVRIYTTVIPTDYRNVTLMQDGQYRVAIAWQNTAYNQPPHLSYDLYRKLTGSK